VVMSREEAVKAFSDLGEEYKVEIIKDLPGDEDISVYRQGDWMDLCRGPHVPSTGKLNAFKLTKVAGAYWRGDQANAMLQRIYGTAWGNKKALKAYLNRISSICRKKPRAWCFGTPRVGVFIRLLNNICVVNSSSMIIRKFVRRSW
jgi:threonyl-tRNA synthetase